MFLLLHVYAPAVELAQRRPYNLHLCVDVSGSMNGNKIEFARYGLGRLLDALGPGHRRDHADLGTLAAVSGR